MYVFWMTLPILSSFVVLFKIRRPPRSTRTHPLFPYTTLFRSTYRLRSDGAVPCMELPSHIPNDLDYDWYVHKAETMLCNMGAMADSPVHVECTTSKCKLSRTSDEDEAA